MEYGIDYRMKIPNFIPRRPINMMHAVFTRIESPHTSLCSSILDLGLRLQRFTVQGTDDDLDIGEMRDEVVYGAGEDVHWFSA